MAAIPRPASSVVLLDDSFRVYLTKRPKSMKLLGGYVVFPGGKVDQSDFAVNQQYIKIDAMNDSAHYSYYIAAARELYEEIGILLVCEKNSMVKKKEAEYRQLLINGEISFMKMLEEEELQLDLTALKYFGQIITPEFYPQRFDTRFFLAKLPKRQKPNPHPEEIESAFWLHPETALRNYEYGEMQIAPPTIHILKTLVSFREKGELVMPEYNISDYFIPSELEQLKNRMSAKWEDHGDEKAVN